MNLLVTGIYGFVGSNLVAVLKGNCHFYGLDIVTFFKDGVLQTFSCCLLYTSPSPRD